MKPSATCFWLTGIWGEDKKSPGLIGRCHKVSQAYKEKKLSNSSLPVKVFL
jgi:hypothetical protein